jgi:membrane protease YdiL (CAAX protease family)
MQDVPEKRPAFLASGWSGFGCAAVGCLSYALFAVAQIIVFVIVLFRVHPDAAKLFSSVPPPHDAAQTLTRWTLQISSAPNLFLFALVGDGAMILVAIALARMLLGASLSQLGLAARTSGRQVFVGALTGLALVIVSQIVSAVQAKLFGPHPETVAELLKTHHGTLNFVFDFASVCVIAPFAEELLFRGVVFAGLAQRLPLMWAAVLSGIIFGVAHLDAWSIAPLAVIGVGLALLYYRTGSLWPNVVAHATVNTVALVAVYFLPQFAT